MDTVNLGQSQQGGRSFPTTKRTTVAFMGFFLLLAHFPVSESQAAKCADPSSTKSKCLSGKYKTARALVGSTLKCDATAVRKGVAVDPECEQKTTDKLTKMEQSRGKGRLPHDRRRRRR